ncbi:hypothetical protein [Micromonospora sp. NPDC048169]|uniref:hypothetical protein n=1 Tax=Micromonospora sp. NPDC048169 TaxID=3154711 RepID=UPI0033F77A04
MTWTQPLCQPCRTRDERGVFRRIPNDHSRICCSCGEATSAGIYIRIDPASVPYPSED